VFPQRHPLGRKSQRHSVRWHCGTGIDRLEGGSGRDGLHGEAGDDRLFGGANNDTLQGGDGNDRHDGGTGADLMTGGSRNDTYIVDHASETVIDSFTVYTEMPGAVVGFPTKRNAGTDTVYADRPGYTLPNFIENLVALRPNAFAGTGNTLNNTVPGPRRGGPAEGTGWQRCPDRARRKGRAVWRQGASPFFYLAPNVVFRISSTEVTPRADRSTAAHKRLAHVLDVHLGPRRVVVRVLGPAVGPINPGNDARHQFHSSSSSCFAHDAFGFLVLSQSRVRTGVYRDPRRR